MGKYCAFFSSLEAFKQLYKLYNHIIYSEEYKDAEYAKHLFSSFESIDFNGEINFFELTESSNAELQDVLPSCIVDNILYTANYVDDTLGGMQDDAIHHAILYSA